MRLEFFGDELESMRFFDPLTQVSREEISSVMIPPAGELGLLKRRLKREGDANRSSPTAESFGTLLDYLAPETLILLCEPAQIQAQREEYERQVPEPDPLFIRWQELAEQATTKGMIIASLASENEAPAETCTREANKEASPVADLESLEAFRPLAERTPDPQVAQEQRREFFGQMHRWLRQDYAVHVFCNNDGERERFLEIWKEYGFERPPESEAWSWRTLVWKCCSGVWHEALSANKPKWWS